jgi:hypothetical protein
MNRHGRLRSAGRWLTAQRGRPAARTLENSRLAKARAASEREAARARREVPESDENFAYIAGYTEGGAAYGVTWEEWEALEKNALVGSRFTGETRKPSVNEQLPF